MATIDSFLSTLKSQGLFSFYLPFLLVFAIFYGLLEKSKIFGETGKRINILVALVAAFYVVGVSPASDAITSFFANFFTQTSIVIVTIIAGLMIFTLFAGLTGKDVFQGLSNKLLGAFLLLTIIIGVWIFANSGGLNLFGGGGGAGFDLGLSPDAILLIILVAITAIAIWFVGRESSGKTS